MSKSIYLTLSALLIVMSTAACNHSNNSDNSEVQESFGELTTSTFAIAADDDPIDIEDRNIRFDIEDNEMVFDQLLIDRDFIV